MGQALYRKYRSTSLGEVIGQEHITQTLANAIASGRISHAYLFTGPRGVGKTSIARILAHEINKLPYDGTEHIDIIEIDAASNNGVEDIRDIREKVRLAPASAEYKVYIIDEVHMLSTAAFNALLKTLEEPPRHAVFILATTEAHKLPATIVSRSQQFSFRPIDLSKVAGHLRAIATKESIAIDDQALQLIAEHGEGSFRDSISLLDQLANLSAAGDIATVDVEQLLGLAPQQTITTLLSALLAGDAPQVFQRVQQAINNGVNITTFNNQLISFARQKALESPDLYRLIDRLIDVPRSYNPRVKFESTVMQFALQRPQSNTPAPKVAAPPAPPAPKKVKQPKIEAPESQLPAPASIAAIEKVTTKEPSIAVSPPAGDFYIDDLPEAGWKQILAAAKTKSPTLYTIIRQAIYHFDTKQQLLTLTFRFPLHQKRFDEQRLRTIFAAVLHEVIGGVPAIQVVVNRDAAKKDTPQSAAATTPEPAKTATDTVLAMMGGEVVNA